MLRLEQIRPWMLLHDRRCRTRVRVIDTTPIREGRCTPLCKDEAGNVVRIELGRGDEPYLREGAGPLLPGDPAAVLGCLLGGAAGDALGAPVEFAHRIDIRQQYGADGLTDMLPGHAAPGAASDNTQQMLFVAEGLLEAARQPGPWQPETVAGAVHRSLLRWLHTQGETPPLPLDTSGGLLDDRRLHARRAADDTSLQALRAARRIGAAAGNACQGNGALMRSAPCAFFPMPFASAAAIAALTHGHPGGQLPAALFADLLARLWRGGGSLAETCRISLAIHGEMPGLHGTRRLLEWVLARHAAGARPTPQTIDQLGGGWEASEALAIGVWCALGAGSVEDGLVSAVNHSGDSDTTGMIAGNLLGLLHGPAAIPERWRAVLELGEPVERLAHAISCRDAMPAAQRCSKPRSALL